MTEAVIDKPIDTKISTAATTTKTEADADANADGSLLDKKADEAQGKESADGSLLDGDKSAAVQKEVAKPVVPEAYADPKLPEGMVLAPELKTKFDSVAKESGLSQEQYQKFVDVQMEYTEAQMKQTMDAFTKQIQEWKDETKKELGADMTKTLSVASKAIDTIFTNPEENKAFREMMTETGMGNWKLMVKAFTFVGEQLKEDKFVAGKSGDMERKSTEDILFDHPTSIAARKGG